MKIAIDVSLALNEVAGVTSYARGLLEGLAEIDEENEYLLYSYLKPPRSPDAVLPRRRNFRFRELKRTGEHWERVWWEAELPPKEALEPVDVIHSPFFNAPRERHGALVVTIYDVSFLVYPQFHTEANRLHCLNGMLNAALYADRMIVISHHTKGDLQRYLSVPDDRIRVIHLAPRKVYYPERNVRFIQGTLDRLGIDRNFILFVGTLEPRKNLKTVMRAYATYVKNHGARELLVVAGGKGWLSEDIHNLGRELGLAQSVKFLGYVPECDLRVLYSAARLFVFPSFYEGFGLPVAEAMACGAPVITARTSALPEVAGDAGILVDPHNVEELVEAIRAVLMDHDLRLEMRRKALERAKLFSWEKTAKETLAVYQEVSR